MSGKKYRNFFYYRIIIKNFPLIYRIIPNLIKSFKPVKNKMFPPQPLKGS